MTRGVKIRLMAFLALSAVGIVYVAASFLGLTDRVLGRELVIYASLPTSGGLYTGSEVDYRGVKVGKVTAMRVTPKGLKAKLTLKQDTKVPLDTKIYVHNLSAVGEQYLDFEPADDKGPYATKGTVLHGTAASLPLSNEVLLTRINAMVDSVNPTDLSTVVSELGTMFSGTAGPLQRMVDSGTTFVDNASAHTDSTIALLDTGQTVLKTQAAHEQDIRSFAKGLADITGTLKTRDADLRTILQGGSSAAVEVNDLMKGLQPTIPVLLSNVVTVNQVLYTNLPALRQTLVLFPHVIAAGFTGTPGDSYGHINLQFNSSVGPCTDGYKPKSQWKSPADESDGPVYPAQCKSGPPYEMRGYREAPTFGSSGSANRVGAYDAKTGTVDSGNGATYALGGSGGLHTVFGDDSWKWMLTGATSGTETTR